MRHTIRTMLTASIMIVAAMIGVPSAHSQTIIIIGNGAQPYYQQPYAYSGYYPGYGYYRSYYNYPSYGYGYYYRPYGYGYGYASGYGWPHRWGYRGWW